MADFCNQCAKELGLPEGDFCYQRRDAEGTALELPPDHGWQELCEGCGPTLVDDFGNCLFHGDDGKERKCLCL